MSANPEAPIYCAECGKLIATDEPWQAGLEGGGAHIACLETISNEEEERG